MKANELMIGDYVYNHRNWECPIVEIHKNSAVVIAKHYGEEEFLLSDLRPIPLVPEILEKNGFKKYNELYRLDIAEGVFVNVDFKSKEPFVSVHNTCYRATPICWYLHQLQHALKLCGIEKTIEL